MIARIIAIVHNITCLLALAFASVVPSHYWRAIWCRATRSYPMSAGIIGQMGARSIRCRCVPEPLYRRTVGHRPTFFSAPLNVRTREDDGGPSATRLTNTLQQREHGHTEANRRTVGH